jgi:hypothetical protein
VSNDSSENTSDDAAEDNEDASGDCADPDDDATEDSEGPSMMLLRMTEARGVALQRIVERSARRGQYRKTRRWTIAKARVRRPGRAKRPGPEESEEVGTETEDRENPSDDATDKGTLNLNNLFSKEMHFLLSTRTCW